MSSKLDWCMKQVKGIKLVTPNDELCDEYLKSSEEDLINLEKVTGKWISVTAYYACYNALYAFLCKIGIKCEIHDCTIALMDLFGYDDKDIELIEELKKNRVDVQYYLKEPKKIDFDIVKKFIAKTKEIIMNIDEIKKKEIRAKIQDE